MYVLAEKEDPTMVINMFCSANAPPNKFAELPENAQSKYQKYIPTQ
jgi:hypothetical protein